MTILRRFLVVQMIMLWQGGFLFYAAVVVPIGTEVLGGSFEQGAITRFVTQKLNWIGVAAVGVFGWELLASQPPSRRQRRLLWGSWLILSVGLVALFLVHPLLMDRVDFAKSKFLGPREEFRF